MAKLDGTNGLIQQYDYQVLTTGFTYTFASGTQTLVMNPAGTLATGTITMPAAPADGMSITIESTQTITAITVQGNTGQSIVGAPTQLLPNQPLSWVYRVTNTTWYPLAGAGAVAPLVSGTAVASTSGTSIDFTSIPSWVKRITVMLNGVSTNGAYEIIVRLGTSGGIVTSGYNTQVSIIASTNNTTRLSKITSSFPLVWIGTASYLLYGNIVFTNLTSNTWTGTGLFYQDQGGADAHAVNVAGAIALGGTLDRVRLTTNSGTDTFDAGSVNILYE